jgi:hypothetical protein
MRRRTFLSEFTPQRTTLTHEHHALPHFLQVRLGAGGECPKRRATSPYKVPRWATPETRRWATPQTPPSVGHTSSPPSGHSRSPSGTCAPSVGRPSTLRWTPIRVSVCPARPLGIAGFSVGPLRRASPSGHSIGLLCRATPSGFSVGPLRLAHSVWPTVPQFV